jgi:hypothetical protein
MLPKNKCTLFSTGKDSAHRPRTDRGSIALPLQTERMENMCPSRKMGKSISGKRDEIAVTKGEKWAKSYDKVKDRHRRHLNEHNQGNDHDYDDDHELNITMSMTITLNLSMNLRTELNVNTDVSMNKNLNMKRSAKTNRKNRNTNGALDPMLPQAAARHQRLSRRYRPFIP